MTLEYANLPSRIREGMRELKIEKAPIISPASSAPLAPSAYLSPSPQSGRTIMPYCFQLPNGLAQYDY